MRAVFRAQYKATEDELELFTTCSHCFEAVNTYRYESMGGSVQARMEADGEKLTHIKQVMRFANAFEEDFDKIVNAMRVGKGVLEALKTKAEQLVRETGNKYCDAGLGPLNDAHAFLKIIAAGTPDGSKWADQVGKSAEFRVLYAKTAKTLRDLDWKDLKTRTLKCHTVLA